MIYYSILVTMYHKIITAEDHLNCITFFLMFCISRLNAAHSFALGTFLCCFFLALFVIWTGNLTFRFHTILSLTYRTVEVHGISMLGDNVFTVVVNYCAECAHEKKDHIGVPVMNFSLSLSCYSYSFTSVSK